MSHRDNTKLQAVRTRETATLQLRDLETPDATQDDIESWTIDGEIYAQLLSDPKCPKAFREAFAKIFTEHIVTECHSEHPGIIRQLFPLLVTDLQSWIPADATRTVAILRTLRETLAPELTAKIQADLESLL